MVKKLLLSLILLFFPTLVWGAELLIKAQEPWNNNANTSKMTAEELVSFNARSRKGDIIVVRPDGWPWGKEERPPRFIVLKIPKMSVEEAKKYEESLSTGTVKVIDGKEVPDIKLLKVRKYQINIDIINNAIKNNKDIISIKDNEELINNLNIKDK